MTTPCNDSPGIKVPPPIFLLLTFGSFIGAEQLAPAPLPIEVSQWWGLPLMIIGLVIALSAVMKFLMAGNDLDPNKPSNAFVVSGFYRVTRNPMYLGAVISFLGTVFLIQSLWLLLATLTIALYFERYVIPCEEAYMKRRYGKDYNDYCLKVRKWM